MGVVYYRVLRMPGDVFVVEGHTVHTPIGASGRPCRLPPRVRELLG